jgi:hypothetical protein
MPIKVERFTITEQEFEQIPDQSRRALSRHSKRDGHDAGDWEFLALDGEGSNTPDGYQHYVYLAGVTAKGEVLIDLKPRPGEQYIRTLDFFKAIFNVPKRYKMIGYYFDYDVNKLLFDMLKTEGDQLKYLRRLQQTHRVMWKNYLVTYIKRKQCIITRLEAQHQPGDKTSPDNSRCIWDVSGFFQGRLTKTINEWQVGSKEEHEFIERMKALRDKFNDDIPRETIEEYCRLECELTAQVANKLRDQFQALTLPVTRWDGAGAVAAAILKKHHVEDYMHQLQNRLPDEVIKSGYYGGRFDQSTFGKCGDAIQYDINSAYPHQLMSIPCLSCNSWDYTQDYDGGKARAIWHVSWDIDESAMWSPFPYRYPDGTIHWLRNGSGWYWNNEVQAALAIYPHSISIGEGYILSNKCDHRPFEFVKDYYEQRKQLKLAGDLGQLVIKLGLNSLYGKTAQGKGNKDTPPKTQCLIWAGMITSDTRAMLLQALAEDPNDVLLMATDAVIKRTESKILDVGSNLGQWDRTELKDLFIIANGVYQATTEHGKFKSGTRGYDVQDFTDEVWQEVRDRSDTEKRFDFFVPVTQFITMGQVVSGQEPISMWGQWKHFPKKNSFGKFKSKLTTDGWDLYPPPNKYDTDSTLYEPELYRSDDGTPIASYRLLDDDLTGVYTGDS